MRTTYRANLLVATLGIGVLGPLAPAWGQLYAPNEAGVALGQWYTIVRDVDATKKFWILLGGTPMKIDGTDVMKFPGVFIFLMPGTPSGGNEGAATDHVGFGVPSVQKAFAKWTAAGVKKPEVRKSLLNGEDIGYLYSPDDLRLEISEEIGVAPFPQIPPNIEIESNHIHFHAPAASTGEMQAWYVKMFSAIPGELHQKAGPNFNLTGDIPGAKFMYFSKALAPLPDAPLPTRGRTLDHIGFEVKNLQAFCKKLEANGVKLDAPYSKTRHKSFASAELIDPWGTSIELTEGLNNF